MEAAVILPGDHFEINHLTLKSRFAAWSTMMASCFPVICFDLG